ncbi:MAG: hypothetical protein RLZZ410_334 [Pseudomonadota bacterium]|jgi:hypothetical protein
MFSTFFSPTIILISAFFYALSFGLNSFLLESFTYSLGVAWIFLPAGLRLLLTLLFAQSGAVGIALASSIIAITFYFNDLMLGLAAGITSGLAPYIARYLALKDMGLTESLANLDGSKLLNCIFIYSLISPILHQTLFTVADPKNDFFDNLGVMIIGDLMGSMIVIYCAKALIYLVKKSKWV